MSHRPLLVLFVVPIAGLCLVAAAANADPIDPRIEKIVADGRKMMDAGDSAYLDLEIDAVVDGQVRMRIGQQVWIGQMERIRVDTTRGYMICVTPEDSVLLETNTNVCLWMPSETFEALGEDGPAARAAFTFGTDITAMWDMWDAATLMDVVGEDTVEGAECWVIGLSGELADAWSGVKSQVGEGFTVDAVRLYVDKEDSSPRRVAILMSGPAEVWLLISILTMDIGVEVAEERFECEIPEDALVVQWDAEKDGTENINAFRAAVGEAGRAQQPPQQ